jgi:hypothetical protein
MNYHEYYKQNQNNNIKSNMSHDEYFENYQGLSHRFSTFKKMFRYLDNISSPLIVETGISRMIDNYTGDGHSTLLFDEYLHFFKKSGMLISIDIDQNKCDFTAPLLSSKSTILCSDSVIALNSISNNSNLPSIDLLYLDSYDVDWNNPTPAAAHHLAELKIVWPLLQPGSIVAVDDNRNGHGKGEQVAAHMAASGVPEIISGYVRAWKVQ